jgi:4-amino-4-deoxy-L-arabinose transferase-like glycosyltransferase
MRGPRPHAPERTDPSTVSPSGSFAERAWKQAGLVLLCGAWIVLGLVGHDPWKSEDAIVFATAWEMVQRGDFLVPHLAQIPYFERGTFVSMLAALLLSLLSPPLAPFDAARLAVGILLALILALTAWTGRELNGRAFRWVPVLVLVGSLGLFDRSHQLSQDVGLLFAVALGLYGLSLAARREILAGVLIGLALAAAFLCYALIGPFWILASALLLPAVGAQWRTAAYAKTLAIAIVVGVLVGGAWPVALHLRSAEHFGAWWAAQRVSAHVPFLADSAPVSPFDIPKNLLWFAWPAVPLIVWAAWVRGRGFNGGLAQPGVQVPGTMAGVMLLSLVLMPEPRVALAIPLLVPLALLAAVEVDSLDRGSSAALDWFGILTFGLAAIALWALWIDAYFHGISPRIASILRDSGTGITISFKLTAFVAALLLTILWIVLVRPARRSNRRAILNWAAGLTLIWGLAATIWLPYIDSRRTYRQLAETMASELKGKRCIESRNVGDPQRGLFYYFSGIVTQPLERNATPTCPTLLVQYGRLPGGKVPPIEGWRLQWSGARRGDESERFAIYTRASK